MAGGRSPELAAGRKKELRKTSGKIDKFVVEKAVAEDLPPGWRKELRVRNKGGKIRKDPYYTDPATGYIFRSLKDVQRYLKTGKLGRLAFKPKDDRCDDMELQDEKLPVNAEPDGDELANTEANGEIAEDQSPKLVELQKDERIIESTNTTDDICMSENVPKPCKENAAVVNGNLQEVDNAAVVNVDPPEADASEKSEEKSETAKQMSVPTSLIETSPDNQPEENGMKENGARQPKRNKSSAKSNPDVPRRSSKRLAGVEINVTPGPKTRLQAITKRTRAADTRYAAGLDSSKEHGKKAKVPRTPRNKQESPVVPCQISVPALEASVGKVEIESKQVSVGKVEIDSKFKEKHESDDRNYTGDEATEKKGAPICLPEANILAPVEQGGKVERENSEPQKNQEELLTHTPPPNNLNKSKEHEGKAPTDDIISKGDHIIKVETNATRPHAEEEKVVPPKILSRTEQYSCKIESKPYQKQELPGVLKTNNEAEVKPDSPINMSLPDFWTDPCIEFAVKTLTGAIPIPIGEETKRPDEIPRPPLEVPLEELWTDPCIEFAVKTLTGDIPVGGDICVQDYLQQSSSSSDTRGEHNFTFPDIRLNNSCQAGYPLPKQQDPSVPLLQNHRNVSLQNLGNNSIQQHGKKEQW